MPAHSAHTAFRDYSRGVAASFLQTVVVVDDKAETRFEEKTDADKAPAPTETTIVEPGRRSRSNKIQAAISSEATAPASEEVKDLAERAEDFSIPLEGSSIPAPSDNEILPIKYLNQAFAQRGIVCGFLSPSDTGSDRETIIQAAEKIAKRSDIVILDWKMEGKEEGRSAGYTATRIIKKILENDEKGDSAFQSSGRLRLIVIYSQSPVLSDIIDDIAQVLETEITPAQNFERPDQYTLLHESTRICAFRKAGGSTNDDRTFDVKDLTGRVIEEFTCLTEGLLSNVAIGALSALRSNTHKILQKFKPALDAPYLTHRALTSPAEETQSHPIALLASEMHDVLEGSKVVESISPELIKLWIESLPERIKLTTDFTSISTEQLPNFIADAVVNGINQEAEDVLAEDAEKEIPWKAMDNAEWKTFANKFKSSKKDETSKFTNLMLGEGDKTGAGKDREFSILTTVRSHYSVPPPYLTLGTIVAKRSGELAEYYVCIQPVCDCVRLECPRRFPFLKLEIAPTYDPKKPGKFDFILKNGSDYLELKVSYKPYDMELFTFTPDSKLIKAQQVGGEWLFKGVSEAGVTMDFQWLADLKFPHAQRVAGKFGVEMSRVGLTESEWLRRMAG